MFIFPASSGVGCYFLAEPPSMPGRSERNPSENSTAGPRFIQTAAGALLPSCARPCPKPRKVRPRAAIRQGPAGGLCCYGSWGFAPFLPGYFARRPAAGSLPFRQLGDRQAGKAQPQHQKGGLAVQRVQHGQHRHRDAHSRRHALEGQFHQPARLLPGRFRLRGSRAGPASARPPWCPAPRPGGAWRQCRGRNPNSKR